MRSGHRAPVVVVDVVFPKPQPEALLAAVIDDPQHRLDIDQAELDLRLPV